MDQTELKQIKDNCQYLLHGHYPLKPMEYFIEMTKAASVKEDRDHYGQGESLQQFEKDLAKLLGFEDCIFLASGTMAQQMALRIWSEQAGNPLVAFHPTSHLEIHEQNSYKELHNLNSHLIGKADRLITLEDLKKLYPTPSCVLLELPQREIGGQLPAWEDLKAQVEYLRSRGIKVHLDGARLWECSPYYQKSPKDIASLFDSVYVSFYKGIGAVAGAALLGSKEFIKEARIWNRRHGGNLITLFPLYISARHNLQKRLENFDSYYSKTLEIAEGLVKIEGLQLLPQKPQVNMFHLYIKGKKEELLERAIDLAKQDSIWGLAHLQQSERSGYCILEWYIGDATMDIPTVKILEYLKKLLLK